MTLKQTVSMQCSGGHTIPFLGNSLWRILKVKMKKMNILIMLCIHLPPPTRHLSPHPTLQSLITSDSILFLISPSKTHTNKCHQEIESLGPKDQLWFSCSFLRYDPLFLQPEPPLVHGKGHHKDHHQLDQYHYVIIVIKQGDYNKTSAEAVCRARPTPRLSLFSLF